MATSEDCIKDTGTLGLFVDVEFNFEILMISSLYVPEPFLWDVLHHLVEAAVAMLYGSTDGSWGDHKIVHRDIKPGNSPTLDFYLDVAYTNRGQFLGQGGPRRWDSVLPSDQAGRLGPRSADQFQ